MIIALNKQGGLIKKGHTGHYPVSGLFVGSIVWYQEIGRLLLYQLSYEGSCLEYQGITQST